MAKKVSQAAIRKMESICGKIEALQHDPQHDSWSRDIQERIMAAKNQMMDALNSAENGGRY